MSTCPISKLFLFSWNHKKKRIFRFFSYQSATSHRWTFNNLIFRGWVAAMECLVSHLCLLFKTSNINGETTKFQHFYAFIVYFRNHVFFIPMNVNNEQWNHPSFHVHQYPFNNVSYLNWFEKPPKYINFICGTYMRFFSLLTIRIRSWL